MDESGGYEMEWAGEVSSDLHCAICLLVLRSPVQVMSCGHRFCTTCFDGWKNSPQARQKLLCPEDNLEVDRKQVFPDKAAERTVNKLQVKCSHEECEWQGALVDFKKHSKTDCTKNSADQVKKLRKDLEKLDKDYSCLKTQKAKEVSALQTKNNELAKKLKDSEAMHAQILKTNEGLNKRLNAVKSTSASTSEDGTPAFVWIINRASGVKQTSAFFYTEKRGYLCQLRTRKSVHLSLQVLQGPFDEGLVWPFSKKVRFVVHTHDNRKFMLTYPLNRTPESQLSGQARVGFQYVVFLKPAQLNSCLDKNTLTIYCYFS